MKDYKLYIPKRGDYEIFRKELQEEKLQDKIIKRVEKEREFMHEFLSNPENTNKEKVEKRVRKLNTMYSTRLSMKENNNVLGEIINRILYSEFDDLLDHKGYEAVAKLRVIKSERTKSKTIDCFSFATKYCHHCRPNKFPIYDSLNMRVMNVYYGYKHGGKDYEEYVKCHTMFCEEFITDFEEVKRQNSDEGFYIDKYIQAIGGSDLRTLLP